MTDLGSRKPNITMPLTPLMAKLSLLAMEQRGGWGGGDVTTPGVPTTPLFPIRPVAKANPLPEKVKKEDGPLEEKVLYVCGYQDMTLLLILDSKTSQDPDQIHSLVSGHFKVYM